MFFRISGTFIIPFHIVTIHFVYTITTRSSIQTNIRFPPRTTNRSCIMFHQILIKYYIEIVVSVSCDKMCLIGFQDLMQCTGINHLIANHIIVIQKSFLLFRLTVVLMKLPTRLLKILLVLPTILLIKGMPITL